MVYKQYNGGKTMDRRLINKLNEKLNMGVKLALATIVGVDGSSPGLVGSMMFKCIDGEKGGTVGGGNLEYQVEQQMMKCIEQNKSGEFYYDLDHDTDLKMICGGKAKVFIKVFSTAPKLMIVGGGHIGQSLYALAKFLGFEIAVFDDREDYVSRDKYPDAERICGNIGKSLNNYQGIKDAYVVIATRGHRFDSDALSAVVDKNCAYVGMIGSKKKVKETYEKLKNEGVSKEVLKRVYAPIGIDIDNGTPNEIAFSIMSEILVLKNKGQLEHLKVLKDIM